MDALSYGVLILGGWVTNYVAGRKGYDRDRWFLLGLLCWPIALTVILRKPDLTTEREQPQQVPGEPLTPRTP